MNFKGSKTEKNLLSTFAGESKARNKYTFYGEKARMEGYQYIGEVFDETASNEKAHAREVFGRYLGMVKSTMENLKDAIFGETLEATDLYKRYEKEARAEGFDAIGDFYKELREVEENHMNRFRAILSNMEQDMTFKRNTDVKWQCMNCGYIHVGKEAPEKCPLCKFPRAYFQIYCENFK